MSENSTIRTGRYRHYKGNEYTVIGMARHSETLEEMVVYRQEYGEHGLWVRPREMFSETVTVDGREVPRFQVLGSKGEDDGSGIRNLFDDLPEHLPRELVQILVRASDVRIERIIRASCVANSRYDGEANSPRAPQLGAHRLRRGGQRFDQIPI